MSNQQRFSRRGRVLVVEDDDGVRAYFAEVLALVGHLVVQSANGSDALCEARRQPFDVVITDLRMPGGDGMTLVRTLRKELPNVEVIILTAFGEVRTAVEAIKLGAFEYREKPLESPGTLQDLVQRALERNAKLASADVTAAAGALLEATAVSPQMKRVIALLTRVATVNTTVLLLGESGTGKEVVARALHAKSARAPQPFVAINCACLTETMLQDELFGHEKGAFTGAHSLRRGCFELADGGTLFLDEVGEIPVGLQAQLLRVLQERRFERLGGSRAIEVDVRVVAATKRNLRKMVDEGSFRDDLFHRLCVFPITLPPLRERSEDIVPLARTLLPEIAATDRIEARQLDASAEQLLRCESWPGNVRELRNALTRTLILTQGPTIRAEDLQIEREHAETPAGKTLAEIERDTIVRVLEEEHGNYGRAAKRLGISVRTLYDKRKLYGLP